MAREAAPSAVGVGQLDAGRRARHRDETEEHQRDQGNQLDQREQLDGASTLPHAPDVEPDEAAEQHRQRDSANDARAA